MLLGEVFVLDEINLAEDAVIERLNSVLEPGRTITLAEKSDGDRIDVIKAHPDFRFIATMNPGGDFGKRDLSAALRSRFTEVWVSGAEDDEDLVLILIEVLRVKDAGHVARIMTSFLSWVRSTRLGENTETSNGRKGNEDRSIVSLQVSLRDILSWADFISRWRIALGDVDIYVALVQGASAVLLDGLGVGQSVSRDQVHHFKDRLLRFLISLCPEEYHNALLKTSQLTLGSAEEQAVGYTDRQFVLGPFAIPLGPATSAPTEGYVLKAETTVINFQVTRFVSWIE